MELYVELAASGKRDGGKTTVLKIVQKALKDAGYLVSDIFVFKGNEGVIEKLYVTNNPKRLMLMPRDHFREGSWRPSKK